MRHFKFICAALAVVGLALPNLAVAGGPDGANDGHAKHGKRFEAKMKKHRGKMLRERIGLNEGKAQQVEKLMDEFHTRKRALRQEMRANHKALKTLLAGDSNDQRAYQVAVQAMISARAQVAQLHDQEIAALRTLLTPKQQAKALMALHRMKQHMRHRMHRMHRKGRHGSAQGGADGPPQHGDRSGPPQHGADQLDADDDI